MKVFNSQKCPDPDFASLESDQILTTSAAYRLVRINLVSTPALDGYSVLVDFNGNVLTKAED